MIKLQFKATAAMVFYHDSTDWKDGDVRDVEEKQAEHLLDDFPKNFTKAKKGPPNNKAITPEDNKGQ